MSDISSLQARLAQEQARNRELRGYLAELGGGIAEAHRRMDSYQNKVKGILNDSQNRIHTSHENIIRAHELQMEIDTMYARFKNMELANKRIREANNKKYYDFANYTTVRKIVQGMLDNLNLHMISDSVIYRSIEKEHLQTPDYWLTTVLIAAMAWKNDDRELAERAIEISIRLDKKNSAIFYMLFNIRMQREEAALKWFYVYQECDLKGEDQKTFLMLFSLLNKTIQDDVDDRIKYEVGDFIQKVIAMNLQAEGYSEERILDEIEHNLLRMKGSDTQELNMLKRCLTDYAKLADVMACAENNINILQFIMDVGNVSESAKNEYLDQFINDEIAKPNEVEQSVYETIEYNELIISCYGDVDRANEIYRKQQEHKQKELNLVEEMIDWIYERNSQEGVNDQIRLNMFTLTAWLQKRAVDQYTTHYRERVTAVHPANLGDYQTKVDFTNRSEETRKITEHYEAERDAALGQIKYIPAIIGAILAVAGIAGGIAVQPAFLILAGAGALLAAFNVFSNSRQKKHLAETCEMNIRSRNELMDQLFEEFETWRRQFAEYDAYYDKIRQELDRY